MPAATAKKGDTFSDKVEAALAATLQEATNNSDTSTKLKVLGLAIKWAAVKARMDLGDLGSAFGDGEEM